MKKRIITISREFGSGGHEIGKMVADELGIKLYDKELIALVANESGFSLDFVEETGEYSTTSSLLFSLSTIGHVYGGGGGYLPENMPVADRIHLVQNKVIHEIAARESCVLIGRSADYILRDRTDCLNVFIHSDNLHKVERVMSLYDINDRKQAEKYMQKKDKLRTNHYKHYTGQIFGEAKNYHLCLDSGVFGLDGCKDIILKALE